MRILVISDLLPPRMLGGFELACRNLSQGLRDRGHEVLVLTTATDRAAPEQDGWVDRCLALHELFVNVNLEDDGIGRLNRFESRVSTVGNSLIVLDRIRSFAPDHILMFNLFGIGGIGILDTVRRTGIPWTLNLGDNVPGALLDGTSGAIRELYDVPGGLFASGSYAIVSETLRDEVIATGVPLGPVEVIPRGALYPDLARTRDYRDGGVTRFVAAGILSPHKGVDLMIDAAAGLVEQGLDGFRLEIYGDGLVDHYRSRIAERGLTGFVSIPGRVDQRRLFEIHAGSDAFLFPTWEREPGASAPVEAASVGCVPIMTADCGPAEYLVDGVHTLKIARNAHALADAMARVVRGEVDLAALGAAGRRIARGDLSFSTSVERLEAFLGSGDHRVALKLDTDAIAAEVIRLDDAARRVLLDELREGKQMGESEASPPRASAARRIASLPARAVRRLIRPAISAELAEQRDFLREQRSRIEADREALAAREAQLAEREKAMNSLTRAVQKDILATNRRIDWLENERQHPGA
ncbi:glycosyltransferase [Protaetiibacter larvae]|uniref:glycosyltransferase n=1 Tax=Protaetiibacter larvae TaxID=2592654 RepID=UPI001AEF41D3|nr:glycosyltransferase [Protaetiibacter larvae]